MDIELAKTFLAIAETGSFVAAARNLNITQTAVSARVHSLEQQLGRRLFIRNKSGARLTPPGERFARHAATLVQVWERARQQVGLPAGRIDVVSLGAELSLWNPFLADWLVWMKRAAPDIALRADVDAADRLLEKVHDGSLDAAILYSPPQKSALVTELLAEEKLVMVTSSPDGQLHEDDYVRVDWGPAFNTSHQAAFPHLSSPGVAVSLGPLALTYLLAAGGTGYFRLGTAKPFLDDGRLRRVPGTPEFSYSAHIVYSTRSETNLIARVRDGLRAGVLARAGKPSPL